MLIVSVHIINNIYRYEKVYTSVTEIMKKSTAFFLNDNVQNLGDPVMTNSVYLIEEQLYIKLNTCY